MTPNLNGNQIASNSTPYKRRRQTNQALEALGQLIADPIFDDADNKLNKNDILSLTLARLLREKYWPSYLYNRKLLLLLFFLLPVKSNNRFIECVLGNVDLISGIESSSTIDELNGFFLVLNTSGRIVLLSDNIESYLRKNVVG